VRLWLDGKAATTLGGEGLIVDHPIGRAEVEDSLPAILVDAPGVGARITSPVRVRGSSNVFEAVSFIQITDWDGRVVATKRVMASSGTGTRGTFDVTVAYQTTRPGQGELIVYSLAPKDGKRINLIETPLVVAP
jgi:germination protein M